MAPKKLYLLLGILLACACFGALSVGAVSIPLDALAKMLYAPEDVSSLQHYVLQDIRLPRLICGLVVGMGLAAAGVSTQGVFRNPLADPSLIGVSNGAAVGAVMVIVFSSQFELALPSAIALPIAAFMGGIIATLAVVFIASYNGKTDTALLLLAGIAINAVAGAAIGLMTYIADDNQLRDLTFWSMGSLAKSQWLELAIAAPIISLSTLALLRYRATLNALLMGEAVAAHIGHDVKRCKRIIIVLNTLIVATAVSISGVIFFVGLVVPHLMRLCVGSDHKNLLPLSMLCGAVILLSADIIARSIIAPAELPIGLLMSLLGGPFFIALLLQQRKSATRF